MKEEMKKRGLQPVTFSEVITEVNEQVVDTQICRAAPVDPDSGSGSGSGSGDDSGSLSFNFEIKADPAHGGPHARWKAYVEFNLQTLCKYVEGENLNEFYIDNAEVVLTNLKLSLTGIAYGSPNSGSYYQPLDSVFTLDKVSTSVPVSKWQTSVFVEVNTIVFSPKVKVELCKYGACVTDIITESKYLYVDLSYSVTHGLKPELMLTKIDVYAE